MRIVKPYWPLHTDDKDRPVTIYTLSIHPDGSRLATGGLDTKIKIWSTKPILDEATELSKKYPKLLCTLTAHAGAVMCVRWSNSGRSLASGSDDNIVMVWNLSPSGESGGKVWGQTDTNVENWKPSRRLVGHDSDVSGVAWSHDDAYIASVGLDSLVLIWSGSTFQLLRRLEGHVGFVKGVVFDPVGQYLATQSDDNSVKIWRTSDWALETTITECFKNAPKTNQIRLSWSPEGTHLVTPNSMNGPVFVASVITRSSWTSDTSMVGHQNMVEVAAFSPLVFLRDKSKPATNSNLCTFLALGARSSISLWMTSQSQPLVVLEDVFDRDVLDLSWSRDGTQLWSCSSEGHVAVFTFSLAEFATPIAPDQAKANMIASWNFTPSRPLSNIPPTNPLPQPQHATTLLQQQQQRAAAQVGTVAQPNILMSRKGPNAKRRPLLTQQQPPLPSQPQILPPPLALAPQATANMFQPPAEQVMAAPSHKRSADVMLGGEGPAFGNPSHNGDGVYLPVTRTSDAPYRLKGRTLGDGGPAAFEHAEASTPLRELRPAYIPREKQLTFALTNKEPQEKEGGGSVKVLAVPAVKSSASLSLVDGEDKDTLEWKNFTRAVTGGEKDNEPASKVSVVSGSKTLWVDYLPKPIVAAAGSPRFVAVSMDDGALAVYSPTGRRLLPTLVLDSPCSFLEAEDCFLLAVTALGSLSVWNTSVPKSIFPPLSVTPLLTASATRDVPHPTITTAALRPNGTPILSLSSGSTHSYDVELAAWTRLSELWWSKGSDFWEGRRGRANTVGRGVIRAIESAINDIVVDRMDMKNLANDEPGATSHSNPNSAEDTSTPGGSGNEQSDPTFRNAVSLAHLEVRMKAAIALDSQAEYKTFLLAYARKLSEEGFRSKAEELVKELLGPIYYKPGAKEDSWVPTVAGFNKRDLLKEVLSIFGKSRMIASLGTDYQDILRRMNA